MYEKYDRTNFTFSESGNDTNFATGHLDVISCTTAMAIEDEIGADKFTDTFSKQFCSIL